MTVSRLARHIGVPLTASAAVIAGCVACSSSSNGSGTAGPGGLSTPPRPPTSSSLPTTPVSSIATGSSGSNSNAVPGAAFCRDFKPKQLTHLGSASDIGRLIKIFDKVSPEAPDAVKAQAREVDQFLHAAASGHLDASKISKIEKDVAKITRYYLTNCP